MARIVYSCCGEGRGHSSRTLTLVRRLRSLGHDVQVLASNAAFSALHPHLPSVTEIPGLVLVYEQNRVRVRRTIGRNFVTWREKEKALRPVEKLLSDFRPHLAITDFEPFLPIAARRRGIPFIGIDHQHVIPGLKVPVPPRYWPHYLATLAVVMLTYRGERANLVTSFFQPAKAYANRYHYFGPILREEIARMEPKQNGHALVYQTSSSFERLSDLLKQLPFEFRLYAFNREGRDGNCTFKPRSHPDFFDDLASCSWVLTNGGYTLISEALFLGKPVMSVPVGGQFEQWINAYHLQKLGLGEHCESDAITAGHLRQFVENVGRYRRAIEQHTFDGTEAIVQKTLTFLPRRSK